MSFLRHPSNKRRLLACLAVFSTVTASLGWGFPPAGAAAGDAAAVGLAVDLGAQVGGLAVLGTSVSAGSVAAPPGGRQQLAAVDASGVGVSGGALAVDVSADSGPSGSSARALLNGVDLRMFGRSAVTAEVIEATASCPTFGSGDGETNLASSGLTVLGQPVSAEAGASATVSSAVDLGVAGLVGAVLVATVTRTEVDEPAAARATALEVAFGLTVTPLLGAPQTVDVGQVTLARVSCERPALPPLAVTSLTPPAGPQAGGTLVTISGTGFVPDATTVAFGGLGPVAATVSQDGTGLIVSTPPAPVAGPVDVTVTTPAGTLVLPGAYTYLPEDRVGGAPAGPAPVVGGLAPDQGPTAGGTTVTITGSGLQDTTGVTFGDEPASALTVSPDGTRLTATTPAHESAGPVAVALTGPQPTAAGTFTYVGPTVSAVEPDRGPLAGGTRVILTGSGLGRPGAVTFGGRLGTDLVASADGTTVTVTAPAGVRPGPVDVAVQLAGRDAAAPDAYTYFDDGTRPTLSGLEPDRGPTSGGTVVTLQGSGLAGATSVRFGDAAGRELAVSPDGTRITVTTPAGPAGAAPVTVTFASGAEVLGTRAFTYQAAGQVAEATGSSPRRTGAGLLAQTGAASAGRGPGRHGAGRGRPPHPQPALRPRWRPPPRYQDTSSQP